MTMMRKLSAGLPLVIGGVVSLLLGQNCGGGFSPMKVLAGQTFSTGGYAGSIGGSDSSAGGSGAGTGTATPIVAPPTFVTTANRYDNLASASAVASGAALTITLVPNGTWPATTLTPTLQSGTGIFSPPTVSVPAGSKTPATIVYTPSSLGEHNIKFSNSAGLNNPYQVPLNVFATNSGTAQSLSALLANSYTDQHVFQRDAFSGNATGFSLGSHGWGEVWVQISSIGGATGALWARPYDALSGNATTQQGSGTALAPSPVQVYGAVTASGTVRLLLPAQDAFVYWDIATDQAMSRPIRIAQRVSVADKIGALTRSQKAGWGRGYAIYGNNPTGIAYYKTAIAEMFDMRYAPGGDVQWSRQDGGSADPAGSVQYGEATTAAAMEAGRLFSVLRGVNLGVVADCYLGGDFDQFVSHDGSNNFIQMAKVSDNKLRYVTINMTGWTGVDSAYPTQTVGENKIRFANLVAKITAAIPSVAVIGGNTGDTGIFGNDGSAPLGYTRNQQIWRELSVQNAMVVSLEDYHWSGFNSGHSTQASRTQYARQDVRYLLSRDVAQAGGFQTISTGPTLATTGTLQSGSNVIKIAYNLNGANSLHNYQIREQPDAISFTSSKDSATASDLASLFAVYPKGGFSGAAGTLGSPVAITSVRYDTGFIYITLAASTTSPLTVHYASDFGVSGGSGLVGSQPGSAGLVTIIGDDLDPLKIGIGQSLFAQLDIAISVFN